jgi:hypothetical protein
MVLLDGTITIVALPSTGAGLRFSEQGWQWVLSAYALTFGGLLLLGGRAADLLGRRRVFMAGAVFFTAASLVCGLALPPTPPAAAIADNTNQKEEQTMTVYEYLMKAIQDDARRASERNRLLLEARRARRPRRQRLVPAAPARHRTETGKIVVSENVTLDRVIQDRPVTKASGPAAGSA